MHAASFVATNQDRQQHNNDSGDQYQPRHELNKVTTIRAAQQHSSDQTAEHAWDQKLEAKRKHYDSSIHIHRHAFVWGAHAPSRAIHDALVADLRTQFCWKY